MPEKIKCLAKQHTKMHLMSGLCSAQCLKRERAAVENGSGSSVLCWQKQIIKAAAREECKGVALALIRYPSKKACSDDRNALDIEVYPCE